MLKQFIVAGILTVATIGVASADSDTPAPRDPFANPIEQCIRDHAAQVEASIADLNEAVDFIVGKVCGVPVVEHNIDRNKQLLLKNVGRLQMLCDEQTAAKADQKTDAKPDTSKPATPDYCAQVKNANMVMANIPPYDAWSPGPITTNPFAAQALAAQLLMDLRAARKHHNN